MSTTIDPTTQPAVWWRLEELEPWGDNPHHHPEAQVEGLAAGIEAGGYGSPMEAHWPSRRIIAGHGRRLAMLALLARRPDFQIPGSPGPGWVPVRFRGGTWRQAREAALFDNRIAEEAEWERRTLARVMREFRAEDPDLDNLTATTAFTEAQIASLLRDATGRSPNEIGDPGPAAPLPTDRPASSAAGQVYRLGPHRVACGSNLDGELTGRLLEGLEVRVMITDPPYGIAYKSGVKTSSGLTSGPSGKRHGVDKVIKRTRTSSFGTDTFDPAFLVAWKAALPRIEALYLWTRWDVLGAWQAAMVEAGMEPRCRLIWDKCHFTMGNLKFYGSQTEDCLAWFADGHQLLWEKREGNIWREAGGFITEGGLVDHPTQKPLGIFRRAIERSVAEGEVFADPFLGSGSAVIAAAQTGRIAIGCELQPRYVDVIRDRWTRWALAAGVDPGPDALQLPKEGT